VTKLYEKYNFTALVDTKLKLYAVDSKDLLDHAIHDVTKGTELTALLIKDENHHSWIQLEEIIKNQYRWHIFMAHWERVKANPETSPQISFKEKPKDRGRAIKILGVAETVYLGDPICAQSPNFFWYEATHNGTRIPPSAAVYQNIIKIATAAQEARREIGKPFNITSWYRPEPFNRRAGGARNSTHLSGMAIDFHVEGMTGKELSRVLAWWEGGMGIYNHIPHILHLDARERLTRWGGALSHIKR
jgi:hypothetical protein